MNWRGHLYFCYKCRSLCSLFVVRQCGSLHKKRHWHSYGKSVSSLLPFLWIPVPLPSARRFLHRLWKRSAYGSEPCVVLEKANRYRHLSVHYWVVGSNRWYRGLFPGCCCHIVLPGVRFPASHGRSPDCRRINPAVRQKVLRNTVHGTFRLQAHAVQWQLLRWPHVNRTWQWRQHLSGYWCCGCYSYRGRISFLHRLQSRPVWR